MYVYQVSLVKKQNKQTTTKKKIKQGRALWGFWWRTLFWGPLWTRKGEDTSVHMTVFGVMHCTTQTKEGRPFLFWRGTRFIQLRGKSQTQSTKIQFICSKRERKISNKVQKTYRSGKKCKISRIAAQNRKPLFSLQKGFKPSKKQSWKADFWIEFK